MFRQFERRLVCAISIAAGLGLAAPAAADDVANFFKDKQIDLYVGAGAGGGYGLYARILAEFMPRRIPGSPTITPKFMQGSAGVKATNYLYNVAPKTGQALGSPLSSQPTSEATGRKGARYESKKIHWLGRMVDIVTVVTVKKDAPATTIEGLREREVVAGATGPGSTTHLPFAIMNWALGTKFKIVAGYKGSGGTALAFDRGEVQAAAAPWGTLRTRRKHFFDDVQLVQLALAKDPQGKEVPLLLDLVKDAKKKAAVEFLSAQASIGRTIIAPPGVPKARLEALEKAFWATMQDPDFVAAAKKRKMDLNPLPGPELEKMVLEANAVNLISLNKKWYETDSYKDVREIDILEDKKGEDPTRRIQKNDLMRLVTKGLNRNERLIIILYYYEELTMKEIGATLDLSESRVSQMHSSIVNRLKDQLRRRRPEFA